MWEEIAVEDGSMGAGGEVSVDKARGPRVVFHVSSADEAEGKETICEEADRGEAQDVSGGSMVSRGKGKAALLSGCG